MIFITRFLLVLTVLLLQGCISNNVTPEDCIIKEITVTKIRKGTEFDIVIYDGNTDLYYIDRGLERGVDISVLKEKLLNKKATLHLNNFWFGTSEHISQLGIENEIIFTEFTAQNGYSEF
ncbi:hypothetical protein [Patiriisocius marinus]|uniref:Uncharacterized protein n=1 Tax=Patiriisocius marinus TaxID=1397112 RepID=A0A5J4J3B1_9FLAO|nr:hypothetical protein [Patiriisocius marinus]GER60360.1 hypothetical protein ULMA_24680 [Patiriisocius marinus]